MSSAQKPPLASSYVANVVLVILTLFPGLINTSAIALDATVVGRDLGVAPSVAATLPLLSDAALAFGCILAAECSRRFESRALYFVLLAVSLVASLASALAPTFAVILVAHVVHGLAAGMLFVVVLPPLLTNFGSAKLRATASVMVPALFGASTLGPLVGGIVAAPAMWRSIFASEVVVAIVALVLASRTLERRDAKGGEEPVDWSALALAALGSACIYVGAGRLATSDIADQRALLPFGAGVIAYIAMIAIEALKRHPLVPVRKLGTSLALVGTIATVVGSVTFSALSQGLTLSLMRVQSLSAHDAGLALWPEFLSAIVSGLVFGRLVTTRWVVVSGAAGLLIIAVAAIVARAAGPATTLDAGWLGALGGFGAGLSVSPGLFVVALSFERALVSRAIALLNLFRLTGGFISVPLVQHFIGSQTTAHLASPRPSANAEAVARAYTTGNPLPHGASSAGLGDALAAAIADAYVLVAIVALAGIAAILVLLIVSHARLRAPDLGRFDAGQPALDAAGG